MGNRVNLKIDETSITISLEQDGQYGVYPLNKLECYGNDSYNKNRYAANRCPST